MDQFFALAIHDADVHLTPVQIDSAVELRGGCIILHMFVKCGAVRHRLMLIVNAGSARTLPALQLMLPKNPKGLDGSIKPAAGNAGIAPQLASEHHWPGVPEPE